MGTVTALGNTSFQPRSAESELFRADEVKPLGDRIAGTREKSYKRANAMDLNIASLVQFYGEMKNQTVSLWVWFAAGNFAAVAGYFSAGRMRTHVKLAFLAGFGVYAAGNLLLIIQNLNVLNEVVAVIGHSQEAKVEAEPYGKILKAIGNTGNPVHVAVPFHVIVDLLIAWIVWHHDRPEQLDRTGVGAAPR